MPDQVIDFSTLNTVVFNGTDLTEVIFNGTSIWTSSLKTWSQIGSDITGTSVGDGAGVSIALNDTGNIVAYTSPYNTDGGADSGEVKVFEKIGDVWTQIGSDIEGAPSELATNSGGGTHCVALNGAGDILATSWPGNDDVFGGNTDAGQVRVYKNVSNTWTLTGGNINALTSDTRLGAYNGLSLNTAGNIIAVGGWLGGDQSPGISDPGVVRVYEMVASAWTQIGQTLSGETTGVPGDYNENADYNGYSVDLNGAGNILIAGAPYNDNNDYPNSSTAGHARVFELINGTWAQIGSDIDGGDAFLQYGLDTSINTAGNIVAVGGYGGGTNIVTGVVRVYENINGTWTQIGSDIVGVDADDRTGYSVELNGAGDIIAVGDVIHDTTSANDVGRMRIFKNIDGEWVQHAKDILGADESEFSGWSVALNRHGNNAAVGSPGYLSAGDVTQFPGRGRVRVYSDESISSKGNISNASSFDEDGSFVVTSNPTASSNAGEVAVYERIGSGWSQVGQTIEGNTDGENDPAVSGDADYLQAGGLNSDGSLVLTLAPGESASVNKGKAQVYQYNQSNSTWETYGQELEGINSGDNLGKEGFMSANGEDILIYTGDTDISLQRYHYNISQWYSTSRNPLFLPSLVGRTLFTTPDLEYVVYSASNTSTTNQAAIYKWQPITVSQTYVTAGRYNQHGSTFIGGSGDNLFCPAISPDGQRVVITIDAGTNDPGVVKVYEWSGTAWSQIGQTINGLSSSQNNFNGGSQLGRSAAINGDFLVLGEPNRDILNETKSRGAVRYYQYDSILDEFLLLETVHNPNSISDVKTNTVEVSIFHLMAVPYYLII